MMQKSTVHPSTAVQTRRLLVSSIVVGEGSCFPARRGKRQSKTLTENFSVYQIASLPQKDHALVKHERGRRIAGNTFELMKHRDTVKSVLYWNVEKSRCTGYRDAHHRNACSTRAGKNGLLPKEIRMAGDGSFVFADCIKHKAPSKIFQFEPAPAARRRKYQTGKVEISVINQISPLPNWKSLSPLINQRQGKVKETKAYTDHIEVQAWYQMLRKYALLCNFSVLGVLCFQRRLRRPRKAKREKDTLHYTGWDHGGSFNTF